MSLSSCVFERKDIPWRVIEEEAVLVNVDRGDVVQLNETSAFIWSHMDGEKKVQDIVDCICNEFEVNKEEAEKDTAEFINNLWKKKLIIKK